MNLSEVKIGDKAVIVKVIGYGGFRRRIIEMGFVKGKVVEVASIAPLGDPIEYIVMGYHVSLRRKEAEKIEVISLEEAEEIAKAGGGDTFLGVITEDIIQEIVHEKRKEIRVALVGNPNSGKTSLFNIASGQHQRVGNYSGVTIEAKEGYFDYKGYRIRLVDLPGTYSLSAYSPEERYVRKQLVEDHPDIVINVVDSGNLERNLFLTTQLIDMNVRMVVALNMYDELESRGDKFDYESLSAMIGIPMVPTVSPKLKGIDELFDNVLKLYDGDMQHSVRHIHINYGKDIETAIDLLKLQIAQLHGANADYTPRYIAIKLLEKDVEMEAYIAGFDNSDVLFNLRDEQIKIIEADSNITLENLIQDAKYGFIAGALKETYEPFVKPKGTTKTEKIDNLVTNKYLGYPIFLLALFVMFQATFSLGAYPMDWIEYGIGALSDWLSDIMPSGILRDLLVDGIIQGMGGVLVFLPNILILYFFINLFESTGYMARAAFIMDKIMHKIGLHGRSFIPLIMGFGCNVPSIMAARTIENRNARMVTILIMPLMSCSARLPIYLLFAGAFFPNNAALVLFAIYITGVLLAALMAIIFKKVLFSKDEVPFVMELPPYRLPGIKSLLRDTWMKGEQYLHKIGTVILIGSIVIWALSYFPRNTEVDSHQMTVEQRMDQQSNSYLGQLGQFVQPTLAPLGYDWKTSVAVLTGVAAKEIVVSTIGILYNVGDDEEEQLISRLRSEVDSAGNKVFTPAVAISLMLFVLIYFPCFATIATIKNETGSWWWAIFVAVYTVVLAWIVSFIAYQSIIHDVWQEIIVGIIIFIALLGIINSIYNSFTSKKDKADCQSKTDCPSGCDGCKR